MRYVMKAEFVIECVNEAAAIEATKKATVHLKNPFVTAYLQGHGIKLVTVRIDPKPLRE